MPHLTRIDDLSKPRDFRHAFVEGGVFRLENAIRVIADRKPTARILRILAELLKAEGAIGGRTKISTQRHPSGVSIDLSTLSSCAISCPVHL